MRARALAFMVAFAVVLVAMPSAAAPERSITLTPARHIASWTSDVRVGPWLGEGVGCDREALGCETSLIRISRAGSLSVTTKQRISTHVVDGTLDIFLRRSDAKGGDHGGVRVTRQRSAGVESITARSLAAGYYLLVVTWYDLAVGDYTGTATYVPK